MSFFLSVFARRNKVCMITQNQLRFIVFFIQFLLDSVYPVIKRRLRKSFFFGKPDSLTIFIVIINRQKLLFFFTKAVKSL